MDVSRIPGGRATVAGALVIGAGYLAKGPLYRWGVSKVQDTAIGLLPERAQPIARWALGRQSQTESPCHPKLVKLRDTYKILSDIVHGKLAATPNLTQVRQILFTELSTLNSFICSHFTEEAHQPIREVQTLIETTNQVIRAINGLSDGSTHGLVSLDKQASLKLLFTGSESNVFEAIKRITEYTSQPEHLRPPQRGRLLTRIVKRLFRGETPPTQTPPMIAGDLLSTPVPDIQFQRMETLGSTLNSVSDWLELMFRAPGKGVKQGAVRFVQFLLMNILESARAESSGLFSTESPDTLRQFTHALENILALTQAAEPDVSGVIKGIRALNTQFRILWGGVFEAGMFPIPFLGDVATASAEKLSEDLTVAIRKIQEKRREFDVSDISKLQDNTDIQTKSLAIRLECAAKWNAFMALAGYPEGSDSLRLKARKRLKMDETADGYALALDGMVDRIKREKGIVGIGFSEIMYEIERRVLAHKTLQEVRDVLIRRGLTPGTVAYQQAFTKLKAERLGQLRIPVTIEPLAEDDAVSAMGRLMRQRNWKRKDKSIFSKIFAYVSYCIFPMISFFTHCFTKRFVDDVRGRIDVNSLSRGTISTTYTDELSTKLSMMNKFVVDYANYLGPECEVHLSQDQFVSRAMSRHDTDSSKIHDKVIQKYLSDFNLSAPIKRGAVKMIHWSNRGSVGLQIFKKILIALPFCWIKCIEAPIWCLNRLFSVMAKKTIKLVLDKSQPLKAAVNVSATPDRESDFRVAMERIKFDQLNRLCEEIRSGQRISEALNPLPESEKKAIRGKLERFTVELLRFCQRNKIQDREELQRLINPSQIQLLLRLPRDLIESVETKAIVESVVDVLTDLTCSSTQRAQSERLMAAALAACSEAISRNGQDLPQAEIERLRSERLELEDASQKCLSFILRKEAEKAVDEQLTKFGLEGQNRSKSYIEFLKTTTLGSQKDRGNISRWTDCLQQYFRDQRFDHLEQMRTGLRTMLEKWREIDQDSQFQTALRRTGNLESVQRFEIETQAVSDQLDTLIQHHRFTAILKMADGGKAMTEAVTAISQYANQIDLHLEAAIAPKSGNGKTKLEQVQALLKQIDIEHDHLMAYEQSQETKLPAVVHDFLIETKNFRDRLQNQLTQFNKLISMRELKERMPGNLTPTDIGMCVDWSIDPNKAEELDALIEEQTRRCGSEYDLITEPFRSQPKEGGIYQLLNRFNAKLVEFQSFDLSGTTRKLSEHISSTFREAAIQLQPVHYLSCSMFDLGGIRNILVHLITKRLETKISEVGDVLLRKPEHTRHLLEGVMSAFLEV